MNIKRITGAVVASAILFAPFIGETVSVSANSFYTNQTNAQRADITNWVANTPSQISSNISSQHINVNDLNGDTYVIQWGDTLSGISAATGISIAKLAYDNNISNVNLIYAGDTLILNRDGYVPTNWTYSGDGTQVASTSVTINNFTDNSDHSVNINVSPIEQDNGGASSSSSDSNSFTAKPSGSSDKTSSSDDTDSSTTAKSSSTLDDDEFSDAVSSKLADKLGLDDSSKLEVDFSSSSDDEDTNGDTNSDDSDTQTLYDSDQTITMSSDKMTTKNANKLAKKIYKQLKEDDKLSDINSADEIDLTITADGSDFSFNATLSTESSDDSSSSDSEDTESSDDQDSQDSQTDDQDQNSTSDEDSNSIVTTNSDQNTDSTDSDY